MDDTPAGDRGGTDLGWCMEYCWNKRCMCARRWALYSRGCLERRLAFNGNEWDAWMSDGHTIDEWSALILIDFLHAHVQCVLSIWC